MLTKKNYNMLTGIFYFTVFLVMFIFSSMTPLLSDDYFYSFSLVDWSRISSIKQILQSLMIHRVSVNGRLVPHFFAYLMLYLPKPVFNILNAFNCVFLVLLQKKYHESDSLSVDLLVSIVGVLAVWNFLPAFGNVFFWLTGACNYTWCISLLFLYFLLPYSYFTDKYRNPGTLKSFLLLIFSLIVGTLSENGSFAVILMTALVILYCYFAEHRFDLFVLLYFLAAVIGYFFLITAPSELSTRAGDLNISALAENIRSIALETREQLLPLICTYALLFVLNLEKENVKLLVFSFILFIGAFVSLGMFSAAAYFVDRHFCFTVFFLILACLMLLSNCSKENNLIAKVLLAISIVLFLFNFTVGTIDIGALYMNSKVREQEIADAQASGESVVAITPFYPSSKYNPVGVEDIDYTEEIPADYDGSSFAKYYGFYYVYAKK